MIRKSERYCTAGANLVLSLITILTAAFERTFRLKNVVCVVDTIEMMVSARYVFSVCCDLKLVPYSSIPSKEKWKKNNNDVFFNNIKIKKLSIKRALSNGFVFISTYNYNIEFTDISTVSISSIAA